MAFRPVRDNRRSPSWIAVASPHVLIATPRWVRLNPAAVNHRRFWEATDRLGEGSARDRDPALPHSHRVRARPDRAGAGHGQTSPPSSTPKAKLVPTRSQLADTLGGGGLSI